MELYVVVILVIVSYFVGSIFTFALLCEAVRIEKDELNIYNSIEKVNIKDNAYIRGYKDCSDSIIKYYEEERIPRLVSEGIIPMRSNTYSEDGKDNEL